MQRIKPSSLAYKGNEEQRREKGEQKKRVEEETTHTQKLPLTHIRISG